MIEFEEAVENLNRRVDSLDKALVNLSRARKKMSIRRAIFAMAIIATAIATMAAIWISAGPVVAVCAVGIIFAFLATIFTLSAHSDNDETVAELLHCTWCGWSHNEPGARECEQCSAPTRHLIPISKVNVCLSCGEKHIVSNTADDMRSEARMCKEARMFKECM